MDEEAFRSTGMMYPYFAMGCGGSIYVDDTDKQTELW